MRTQYDSGTSQPAWNHSNPSLSVCLLFAEPYWIPAEQRLDVSKSWIGCMSGYQIYLDQWDSVKEWGVTIYDHLQSRNMPLTTDHAQFWPAAATELLRVWINEGWRKTESDPFDYAERIPPPHVVPRHIRVRKDIRALTTDELNQYRAKLDDVMRVADPSLDSPWQKLGYVHTNWCLHYQEAFLFWHRAYLMYFEQLLDMPVPYWNWMALDANVDGSPNAGIPQAFLDATYIHPETGAERPNPLRFAAAKDGHSKACSAVATQENLSDADCRWVQRNPLFYTTGDDHRAEREKLIRMVRIFQNQVVQALQWPIFSQPEGAPGHPWANILEFDPPQPDKLYPNREDFDGLYEQPHDNWHGWIGFDMADNAYTAFDPVFWSYHANIDRMMEVWIRAHPAAQYTASFPIQPFMGATAQTIEPTDPRPWLATTIGNLARDSRGIGYDFGPPVTPDWEGDSPSDAPSSKPSLSVVFSEVRCTLDSYTIDAFLNQSDPLETDADPLNRHYIGRFSRIGMGIEDDKGRCIRHGVIRKLDATPNAEALGLTPSSDCSLSLLVRNIATGEMLSPEKYRALPGFEGRLVWNVPGIPASPIIPVTEPPAIGGFCCGKQ
jgi:tyrosinase